VHTAVAGQRVRLRGHVVTRAVGRSVGLGGGGRGRVVRRLRGGGGRCHDLRRRQSLRRLQSDIRQLRLLLLLLLLNWRSGNLFSFQPVSGLFPFTLFFNINVM